MFEGELKYIEDFNSKTLNPTLGQIERFERIEVLGNYPLLWPHVVIIIKEGDKNVGGLFGP